MPLSPSMAMRLQSQHNTIPELIGNLPDASLRQTIRPGKWNIQENIAHLTGYHDVFIDRLRRIHNDDGCPQLGRFVATEDPTFAPMCARPLAELLEQMETRRATIISMLADEALLVRKGSHPVYGIMTVTEWTEFFLLHEAHHLYTIFMLVRDLRKPLQ